MPARGILNWNPTGSESLEIEEGYYEGGTLRTDAVYDNGYTAGVAAGTASASPTGNAGVGDVLSGKTFSNGSGKGLTGTMANRGNLNWSGINTTASVAAGYYSGGTLDSRPSYNRGVSDADGRALPGTVNYDTGYNKRCWRSDRVVCSGLSFPSVCTPTLRNILGSLFRLCGSKRLYVRIMWASSTSAKTKKDSYDNVGDSFFLDRSKKIISYETIIPTTAYLGVSLGKYTMIVDGWLDVPAGAYFIQVDVPAVTVNVRDAWGIGFTPEY